ncbi:YfiT family bacillithiol transferase [Aegicerativicinus sediminis]|uniref:YfiT family bacillithiol transferase n=1 Tax=Aegicerativicinus sediminis TaxID=2893202 RepID=UPI001E3DB9CC|nr:bacillithiol transferase BstA [Aegicerativicinus sediminis]
MLEQLKYPIGKFELPTQVNYEQTLKNIEVISEFPQKLKEAVLVVGDSRIDQPYRPEGWSVRQLVHHCADSHLNSICRFKLALTEDRPTIKTYEEGEWAKLVDYQLPVSVSLQLLEALHLRWTALLKSFTPKDLKTEFIHPGFGGAMNLEIAIALYAWHCQHHLAHVTELIKRENWS